MEGILFGLVPVLMGVVSLGYAIYTYLRGKVSESWPKVEATVVHVSIKHAGSSGGGIDASRQEWFLPVIEYTYSARAQVYRGNRIVIGELSSMSHAEALELVRPYREGAKIRVSYDPANPGYAVLQCRVDTGAVARYAIIGAVLLFAVAYTRFF